MWLFIWGRELTHVWIGAQYFEFANLISYVLDNIEEKDIRIYPLMKVAIVPMIVPTDCIIYTP